MSFYKNINLIKTYKYGSRIEPAVGEVFKLTNSLFSNIILECVERDKKYEYAVNPFARCKECCLVGECNNIICGGAYRKDARGVVFKYASIK